VSTADDAVESVAQVVHATLIELMDKPCTSAEWRFVDSFRAFIELNQGRVACQVLKAFLLGYTWGAQDEAVSAYVCRVMDRLNTRAVLGAN
jgi:hypothetical protein